MKKTLFSVIIMLVVFSSCTTTSMLPKSTAYKGIYEEKPLSVLLMPPINRSVNVEAKEFFHSTLNVPIANAGYYVIPPFLSMEILKKESAYDAELFLNSSLTKFSEIFGADMVVFTIIHKWNKSALAAKVEVEIEYIFKSTKTNKIIYTRKGNVTYDTTINSDEEDGFAGILLSVAASAINTAVIQYMDIARTCNTHTFKDLPAGKYSPAYGTDGNEISEDKEFKVILNNDD